MLYKPVDKIADKVIRPGMDKHLVPLCLYKGTVSFGRVHRWWNFSIVAMEQECESISEIVKLGHNADFSHLLGLEKPPEHFGIRGFFNRLRDNENVTNNVPGLTEFSRMILPRYFQYKRVSEESARRSCAPWRVYKSWKARPRSRQNIKEKSADLCYPFILHDPQKTEGADLVARVHAAVPRRLPEEFRADICQDLICAILSGEMSINELDGDIRSLVSAARNIFSDKYKFMSLDAPAYRDGERTLLETLISEGNDVRDGEDEDEDEYDYMGEVEFYDERGTGSLDTV